MHSTQIKNWLKQNNYTRGWLAGQCRVSESTVDGWLSAGRRIPGPSLAIIEELMNNRLAINPKLSLSDYARVQKAADTAGLSVTAWIENVIKNALLLFLLGVGLYLLLP